MKKLLLVALSLLFVFLFSIAPRHVHAAVLFEDNFDDGNDNGWTKVSPRTWDYHLLHVENGRYGARLPGSTMVDAVVGEESWGDYIMEFDMFPITGEDKNLNARWVSGIGYTYGIHFTNGGFDTSGRTVIHRPLINGNAYHMKIILQGKNAKFYLNDELMFDEINGNNFINGKPGLRVSTGGAPTEVWFDNFKVTTLDHTDALHVPKLKQTTSPWGGQLYDSANLWAGEKNTIARWGCALTSAAMVFKYHGVNTMPDGAALDPGSMNSWLKSQPDGYVRGGLINWLALSRLSKVAKEKNTYTFDALEYERVFGENKERLTSDLNDLKWPGILEEPGHFIVATGVDGDTFYINDPFYSRNSLNDYSNTFNSLGRYMPTNTDLSYLMFVVDSDINIKLTDSEGVEVGEQYVQSSIQDPSEDAGDSPSPVKIVYLKKPGSGEYKIELSGDAGGYKLEGYLYDSAGNVKQYSFDGFVGENNSDSYIFNFNKEDVTSSGGRLNASFDSLRADVVSFYKNKSIKKIALYKVLLLKIDGAKTTSKYSKKSTRNMLVLIEKQIKKEKGKGIENKAADILLEQVYLLKGQY